MAFKHVSRIVENALPMEETEILNHLYNNATFLTWFNNASEGWASAEGNRGKTDTSCVLGTIHTILQKNWGERSSENCKILLTFSTNGSHIERG